MSSCEKVDSPVHLQLGGRDRDVNYMLTLVSLTVLLFLKSLVNIVVSETWDVDSASQNTLCLIRREDIIHDPVSRSNNKIACKTFDRMKRVRQESSQVDKYEGGRKSDHFSTFLPPSFSLLFLRMKDDEDKRDHHQEYCLKIRDGQ